MTPLHADILLHYYVSREPWKELTPVHSEYLADLMTWGLIESTKESYETTDKGKALIEAWLSMPFPECKWIIPREYRESLPPETQVQIRNFWRGDGWKPGD